MAQAHPGLTHWDWTGDHGHGTRTVSREGRRGVKEARFTFYLAVHYTYTLGDTIRSSLRSIFHSYVRPASVRNTSVLTPEILGLASFPGQFTAM